MSAPQSLITTSRCSRISRSGGTFWRRRRPRRRRSPQPACRSSRRACQGRREFGHAGLAGHARSVGSSGHAGHAGRDAWTTSDDAGHATDATGHAANATGHASDATNATRNVRRHTGDSAGNGENAGYAAGPSRRADRAGRLHPAPAQLPAGLEAVPRAIGGRETQDRLSRRPPPPPPPRVGTTGYPPGRDARPALCRRLEQTPRCRGRHRRRGAVDKRCRRAPLRPSTKRKPPASNSSFGSPVAKMAATGSHGSRAAVPGWHPDPGSPRSHQAGPAPLCGADSADLRRLPTRWFPTISDMTLGPGLHAGPADAADIALRARRRPWRIASRVWLVRRFSRQ